MKEVVIYTDGACSGNPGPGGWGAILIYGEHRKEMSGGEKNTTTGTRHTTYFLQRRHCTACNKTQYHTTRL